MDEFLTRAGAALDGISGSEPAAGFDEVLYPGRRKRRRGAGGQKASPWQMTSGRCSPRRRASSGWSCSGSRKPGRRVGRPAANFAAQPVVSTPGTGRTFPVRPAGLAEGGKDSAVEIGHVLFVAVVQQGGPPLPDADHALLRLRPARGGERPGSRSAGNRTPGDLRCSRSWPAARRRTSMRTTDLMLFMPYFQGTISRIGAPCCTGSSCP